MRKRFRKGSLIKRRRAYGWIWVAQWWENGHRHNQMIGRVAELTKSKAQERLLGILQEAAARASESNGGEDVTFKQFLEKRYLPFYQRKWKRSTYMTNEDRIRFHLTSEFGCKTLVSLTREEMQTLLDRKAEKLSFSTVDHLRWDLRQIFEMAIAEGVVHGNPSVMLFTPRDCKRYGKRSMTLKEVQFLFNTFADKLRELVILKLAVVAGMRPGEILALRRGSVNEVRVKINERVYKGDIASPKTDKSIREAAVSKGLWQDMQLWLANSPDTGPGGWLFPSEKLSTPISKDNLWRRYIAPRLQKRAMAWVNFQVLRRSHASLMRELDVDPKLVADQQGHTLDVHMNVYAQTSLERRIDAVDKLDSTILVN